MGKKFKELEEILQEIRRMPAFNPPSSSRPEAPAVPTPTATEVPAGTPASASASLTTATRPEIAPPDRISEIDRKFREEVKSNQEAYRRKKQQESAQKVLQMFLKFKVKQKVSPKATESAPAQEAPPQYTPVEHLSLSGSEILKRKIVTPFGTYKKKEYPEVTFWNPGITITAKEGEGILSPVSGTVIASQHIRGYGPTVIVLTPSGEALVFSGLSKSYLPRVGDTVNKGDLIGVVHGGAGMHGDYEKKQPVLQFEVWKKNPKTNKYDAVDPIAYLTAVSTTQLARK